LVKSLLWRLIGILWTWIGAYIILLLVPPSKSSAALIAMLIVVYHHSTRMVMYYAYERIWASVSWGRDEPARPMSRRDWVAWTVGGITAIALVFYLIIFVSPKIKAKRPGRHAERSSPEEVRNDVPVAGETQAGERQGD
jgi:hypothetical protein